MVEKQGSGDDFIGFFVRRSIVDEVEGGKILLEFFFEVFFGKSADIFGFGEFLLESDEIFDVGGVFRSGDRETFARKLVVAGAGAL